MSVALCHVFMNDKVAKKDYTSENYCQFIYQI
jgi:hypothetical protein